LVVSCPRDGDDPADRSRRFRAGLAPADVARRRVARSAARGPRALPDDPASTGSETLRVLAGQDGDGYFLDYFRRDETSAWHGRLRPERPDQDLENYEGQFGLSVFPDPADTAREKQRVIAHNAKVREVLRNKGFED
jgi:hypothetical protein